MTQSPNKKHLYVASERFSQIRSFAETNSVAAGDIRPITQANALGDVPMGIEIWVVGEVGREIAQELSFLTQVKGARIRYADQFDIVVRKDA